MVKKRRSKSKAIINMRARSDDVALIDQAARVLGVTRSAFIRNAAEVRARRILEVTGSPRS